jgi:hypothetical protein
MEREEAGAKSAEGIVSSEIILYAVWGANRPIISWDGFVSSAVISRASLVPR